MLSNSKLPAKSSKTENKKLFVLVPLPSAYCADCTFEHTYIQKPNGSKKSADHLSKENLDELFLLGRQILQRLITKHPNDTHSEILTFADSEVLATLNKDAILYIAAHGSPSAIGTKKEGVNIAPTQLVSELINAKLSPKLRTLKIMACNTAINENNIDVFSEITNAPTLSKNKSSFAENTRKTFDTHDKYKQLDIIGYLGEVADTIKSKNTKDIHCYARFFRDQKNPTIRGKDAQIICLAPNTTRNKEEVLDANANRVELIKLSNY